MHIKNVRTGIYVRGPTATSASESCTAESTFSAGDGTCGVKYPADSRGKYVAVQGLTIGGRPTYGIDFDGGKDELLNVMKCVFENRTGHAIYARNGKAMIEAVRSARCQGKSTFRRKCRERRSW